MFKKFHQQFTFVCTVMGAFMWCAYSCMGVYKCEVVFANKIGAYIYGCLFCVGAYYPDLWYSLK